MSLLKDRSFFVFMIGSFLICIPLAFYYQMAARFITDAGMENPAAKMTLGQMSEVLFMLALPIFLKLYGIKTTLLVGMIAWVVRYAMFSFAADDGVVWMMIGGILLHGICYDFSSSQARSTPTRSPHPKFAPKPKACWSSSRWDSACSLALWWRAKLKLRTP